jgi:DNA-directed RNA polymerase subunit L
MITTFKLEGEDTTLLESLQGEVGRHVLMTKIETKLKF